MIRPAQKLYNHLRISLLFCRHYLKSRRLEGLAEVDPDRLVGIISSVEPIRSTLLQDDTLIQKTDHGAGSLLTTIETPVSAIARSAVSPRYKCQILYRIAASIAPRRILELGSSLGISTLYLSHLDSCEQLTTIEGDPAIHAIASRQNHDSRISWQQMTFDKGIAIAEEAGAVYDLIYIDGHHDGAATLDYIERCQRLLSATGMIIIDDIYWSADMLDAWRRLSMDESYVECTDYFFFGVLSRSRTRSGAPVASIRPFSLI